MGTDRRRSYESTAVARDVLARLVNASGDHAEEFVVIGGLAAPRLGTGAIVPHEGTTDVDILLEVSMDYDLEEADYAWLQAALLTIGARPWREGGHWRWTLDGVGIDLLCDRYPNENHGEIDLPGAPMATAMQLPGPAAARADASREVIEPAAGSLTVRMAGLGGYLLAKAGAATAPGRGYARDWYDFWWVTLHNHGGPQSAAEAMRRPEMDVHFRRQRAALSDLINDGLAAGDSATAYALTMSRLGSTDPIDVMVQDVVAAAVILKRATTATRPDTAECTSGCQDGGR